MVFKCESLLDSRVLPPRQSNTPFVGKRLLTLRIILPALFWRVFSLLRYLFAAFPHTTSQYSREGKMSDWYMVFNVSPFKKWTGSVQKTYFSVNWIFHMSKVTFPWYGWVKVNPQVFKRIHLFQNIVLNFYCKCLRILSYLNSTSKKHDFCLFYV